MPKFLVVHPGASWSIHDVWAGIVPALQHAGVDVIQYALDGRIQYAGGWLQWVWKHNKKQGPSPKDADAVYMACTGILERALSHQVDWILAISGAYLHPEALVLARRAGLRTAMIFTESPYEDEAWQLAIAPLVDVCWVNERSSVARFREVNPRTYYWQHAMDPAKHGPWEPDPNVPAHDVVMVGTGFQERVEVLAGVDWSEIDLGLYGSWGLLGSRHRLRRYVRGGVVPNEIANALYRRARIGLNIHRSSVGWGRQAPRIGGAESLNPRCYELAADGCFFISDWRAELGDVFGGLVPTFHTADHLSNLIRYYLANEDQRRAGAAQLPACVHRQHTFDVRVHDLIEVLEEASFDLPRV